MQAYLTNIIQTSLYNSYVSDTNVQDINSDINQNTIDINIQNSENITINAVQSNSYDAEKQFLLAMQQVNKENITNEQDQAALQKLLSDAVTESAAKASGLFASAVSSCNTEVNQRQYLNMINKNVSNFVTLTNQQTCVLSENEIKQVNDFSLTISDSKNVDINTQQMNDVVQKFSADITSTMENLMEYTAKQSQTASQEAESKVVTTSTAEATGITVGGIIILIIIIFAVALLIRATKSGQQQTMATVTLILTIVCTIFIILTVWFLIAYVKTINGEVVTMDYSQYVQDMLEYYVVNGDNDSMCVMGTRFIDIDDPSVISDTLISKIPQPSTNNESLAYNNMCQALKNIKSSDITSVYVKQFPLNESAQYSIKTPSSSYQYLNILYSDDGNHIDIVGNNGIAKRVDLTIKDIVYEKMEGYMVCINGKVKIHLRCWYNLDSGTSFDEYDIIPETYNSNYIKEYSCCYLYGVDSLIGLMQVNKHLAQWIDVVYCKGTFNTYIQTTQVTKIISSASGLVDDKHVQIPIYLAIKGKEEDIIVLSPLCIKEGVEDVGEKAQGKIYKSRDGYGNNSSNISIPLHEDDPDFQAKADGEYYYYFYDYSNNLYRICLYKLLDNDEVFGNKITKNSISNQSNNYTPVKTDQILLNSYEKEQQIYYWSDDKEVIPIQFVFNTTYIRNISGAEFSKDDVSQYCVKLALQDGDTYYYPKYDGSQYCKYVFDEQSYVYINEYLRSVNYAEKTLSDIQYLSQLGFQYKLIAQYLRLYPDTEKDNIEILTELLTDPNNYMQDYTSLNISNIVQGYSSNSYKSRDDRLWNGQNDYIKDEYLQNFKWKIGKNNYIIGNNYFVTEDDYSQNDLSDLQIAAINTAILMFNNDTYELYLEAQQQRLQSEEKYEKIYKIITIACGSSAAIFLIASIITGVIGSSKL